MSFTSSKVVEKEANARAGRTRRRRRSVEAEVGKIQEMAVAR